MKLSLWSFLADSKLLDAEKSVIKTGGNCHLMGSAYHLCLISFLSLF